MNRIMEQHMQRTTETISTGSKDDVVVLMYPGNALKDQVREFSETLSAFAVAKKAFFDKK